MDRISDSGSDDVGSNPAGVTTYFLNRCNLNTYNGFFNKGTFWGRKSLWTSKTFWHKSQKSAARITKNKTGRRSAKGVRTIGTQPDIFFQQLLNQYHDLESIKVGELNIITWKTSGIYRKNWFVWNYTTQTGRRKCHVGSY